MANANPSSNPPSYVVAVPSLDRVATHSIPKLNGSNFLPWKRQISIMLKLKGLQEALVNDNVNEVIDMNAVMILLSAMDDSHRIEVQAESTAKAIMKSLERQYQDSSAASKHRLIRNFFNYKKEENMTINQHVAKLEEMRAALANMSEIFSDYLFQVVIINSLPSEYGDMLKMWEMVHPSMKTVEFIMSTLQTRERENPTTGAPTALPVGGGFRNLSISERRMYPCHWCKKKGHWLKDCPENPNRESESEKATKDKTTRTNNERPVAEEKCSANIIHHRCHHRPDILNYIEVWASCWPIKTLPPIV